MHQIRQLISPASSLSPPTPPIASTRPCAPTSSKGSRTALAARRFGYSPGSFRVLCHEFRKNTKRAFFLPPAKDPHHAPKADRVREHVIALRKRNLSIYDISRALAGEGHPISPVAVSLILKEEGFSRLPRRRDEERPSTGHPEKAPAADVRWLDLSPRRMRTAFGGLFLFLPASFSHPRRPHPGASRSAGLAEDSSRLRHALAPGPQALRKRPPQSCHERGDG